MPTGSLFTVAVVLWTAATVCFVGLLIYRALISMKEDDQLFLDPAEAAMEEEQRRLVAKLTRLDPYVRGFGFAAAGLLMVLAGLWLYRGLVAFDGTAIP